jgi:hypothetical protein
MAIGLSAINARSKVRTMENNKRHHGHKIITVQKSHTNTVVTKIYITRH